LACIPDKKKGTCLNTTKAETIKYLNPANLVLLVNQQRWDSTTFVSGEKNIIKNSVFLNTQFDVNVPNFLNTHIKINEVQD